MQNSADDENRKRKLIAGDGKVHEETKKRRSRFADDEGSANIGVAAIAAAAARAAEIARNLLLRPPTPVSNGASASNQEAAAQLARAIEMQAQLTAQIASVSSLLSNAQQQKGIPAERKPAYRALTLDAHGREIDEFGQVVRTTVVKSIAANVAVERELKKKENPYLAHQRVNVPNRIGGPPGVPSGSNVLPSSVPGSAIPVEDNGNDDQQVDARIVGSNRSIRAKKSLKFVEAG